MAPKPITAATEPEYLDVLIVGAGISGLGAAYYLQQEQPDKAFALVEARGALGGTWDLFRYPGIRSDSDLHTFGYAFKPWVREEAIAGADAILAYLQETASEHGIDRKIRYHHKVLAAAWSNEKARWTVDIERADTGQRTQLSCRWLFCAGGYYRYDRGFTPHFEGRERFRGQIVHPQHWPHNLDYAGKRIVVIGSGATAVTLIPALAETAAHVTMLQRTPTYILPVPAKDPIAMRLRQFLAPARAYRLTRRKNIAMQRLIWLLCQRYPNVARWLIRRINAKFLPAGYPVDEHFNPPYKPWDQRLCVVPDGDLYKAIRAGKASVVTDSIDTFTERGVALQSGREVEADIIVTATGLNLLALGGIRLSVDGESVVLRDRVAFRGMMLSGVPNFAFALGYTNSSWTLKVDLLCTHFCRLLEHMGAHDYAYCQPELPDPNMPTRPLLGLGAGYVQRAIDQLPRQGLQAPWEVSMNYYADAKLLKKQPVAHRDLRFYRLARQVDPAAVGHSTHKLVG